MKEEKECHLCSDATKFICDDCKKPTCYSCLDDYAEYNQCRHCASIAIEEAASTYFWELEQEKKWRESK